MREMDGRSTNLFCGVKPGLEMALLASTTAYGVSCPTQPSALFPELPEAVGKRVEGNGRRAASFRREGQDAHSPDWRMRFLLPVSRRRESDLLCWAATSRSYPTISCVTS